uniref:Uncharacterized protein n=1 Tax=Anguilla anguilla TaxID=7936 RepID=A0A0E9SMA8_ANGAN
MQYGGVQLFIHITFPVHNPGV